MNSGRKLKPLASKKLAGTYQPHRDGNTTTIASAAMDVPIAPAWLTDGAKAVWAVDLARVVACGATAVDSNMFALFCTSMADFIASVQAGSPANAAFRSELRKQLELLGMAGAKSRLAKITGEANTANPFAKFK